MEEGRTKAIAFLGTIVLHFAVVFWLASSPEAAERILQTVEMDVVDLTPEEEEAEPEPEPEEEVVEPEPEPEPEKIRPRRRIKKISQPVEEEEPAKTQEEPPQGEPEQPPGPKLIDFGMQNLAAPGSGTGWGMKASNGNSTSGGVYRPGAKGGGGGGRPRSKTKIKGSGFSPVPSSQLSRKARLVGNLRRTYPPEARRQYIEGTVRLTVDIHETGKVRRVKILSDPGGGLGKAAASEMRKARFRPCTDKRGRPVDCRIVYSVRYILDE